MKGAANAYREALRIDPSDVNCYYELAFTLCLSGDHNGEVKALRQAVHQRFSAAKQEQANLFDIELYKEIFDDCFRPDSSYMLSYIYTYDQGYHALVPKQA